MKEHTRYVISGSRKIPEEDARLIIETCLQDYAGDEGVRFQHGGAVGFDQYADVVLRELGWGDEHIEIVRPDYDKYPGKVAPIKRNEAMVRWAAEPGVFGCLIAALPDHVTDFTKGGTATTIIYALGNGLEIGVYRFYLPRNGDQ